MTTNMTTQVMQQALNALEITKVWRSSFVGDEHYSLAVVERLNAIDALREAIAALKAAQPVEPADDASELEISDAVVERMSKILANIAITVNGPERPLHRHSYHDLAEKVAVLQLEVDLYRHQAPQPAPAAPYQVTLKEANQAQYVYYSNAGDSCTTDMQLALQDYEARKATA